MSAQPPVVDVCGYVLPAAELIYERLGKVRGHWPRLEEHTEFLTPTPGIGDWPDSYLRFVPEPDRPAATAFPHPYAGRDDVERDVLHDNANGRLRALDALGIDVQLLHPGPAVDAMTAIGVDEGTALLGAYNSYVTTYCDADPRRLKSVIQVSGDDPYWSSGEIRERALDPSVVAVTLHLGVDVTPDHPNFAVVWDALQDTRLPVLQRSGCSSANWAAPRLVSYLRASGVLARWPGLHLAFIEWPPDWAPGWADRLWPSPAADDGTPQIMYATEELDGDDQILDRLRRQEPGGLLWASHFPFDAPRRTQTTVRRALAGEAPFSAALEENAPALLGRRAGVST